jgi:RNA polymerase sigma factor (sigma-70 family)
MTNGQINRLLEDLRKSARLREDTDCSDGELLGAFVVHRDQAAFEGLLRRHGPMVLGVCHRLLGKSHDAEDAFQATFLVLACKAATVVPREAVGNWLYGVAYRTALNARRANAQRGAKEKQVKHMPHPAVTPEEVTWQELQAILDRELNRLGDKYRLPVILCDLEGRTRKEVARQLRIPEGTLSNRLTTARQTLAKRLARVGITLPGTMITAILTPEAMSAVVPASLLGSTLKAATSVATGQAITTTIASAKVVALTKGVLKAMLLSKLKTSLVLALAALCLIAVGTLAWHRATAGESVADKGEIAVAAPPRANEQKAEPLQKDMARPPQENDPLKGAPAKKDVPPTDAAAGPDKESNPYKALPPEILKAWQDAGAQGFAHDMAVKMPDLYFGFVGENHRLTRQPFGPGMLSKLPDPGKPFGLILSGKWVTDAVLKELAHFKNLQLLNLVSLEVTDAGLRELAPLANLQTLVVRHTRVTGTGLKHLAGLKNLRNLYLRYEVTDAGLEELPGLPRLQWLDLTQSKITDVQLQKLAGLKNLQALILRSAYQITDAGMKPVAGLTSLQTLCLAGTKVTDAGLRELAGLKELQDLDLEHTQVTDTGLKELAGLKNLDQLRLSYTKVTDVGLKELAGLKRLQLLILCQTKVTDAGVTELAGLTNLQWLDLAHTQITDAGLKHLAGLTNLQWLSLFGTKTTKAGIAALQKELPACAIQGSQLK